MKKKGFFGYRQYVIAGLLIALAAVGTTAIYISRQEKEREQMEAELAEEMQKQADDIAAEENSEQSDEASALIPPKQSGRSCRNGGTCRRKKCSGNGRNRSSTEHSDDRQSTDTSFFGGAALADGGKRDHQLQHGFHGLFPDA